MQCRHLFPTHMIDISRVGVAFVSDCPMRPGDAYQFNFSFPDDSASYQLPISVLQSSGIGSHGRFRNSAIFLDMPPVCSEAIADYVTTPPPS